MHPFADHLWQGKPLPNLKSTFRSQGSITQKMNEHGGSIHTAQQPGMAHTGWLCPVVFHGKGHHSLVRRLVDTRLRAVGSDDLHEGKRRMQNSQLPTQVWVVNFASLLDWRVFRWWFPQEILLKRARLLQTEGLSLLLLCYSSDCELETLTWNSKPKYTASAISLYKKVNCSSVSIAYLQVWSHEVSWNMHLLTANPIVISQTGNETEAHR